VIVFAENVDPVGRLQLRKIVGKFEGGLLFLVPRLLWRLARGFRLPPPTEIREREGGREGGREGVKSVRK